MTKRIVWLLLISGLITSCTYFIQTVDQGDYTVQGISKDHFSILFSHNINGETHPCGCRHHPLGGLPQIAGLFHQIKQKSDVLYVDSGDTFFASSSIPSTLEKSLTFTAKNLAHGLNELKLSYMLPGEQDLAMGWEFLKEVENENDFTYLVSNPSETFPLKHKRFALVQKGPHKIFFLALADPNIMGPSYQGAFTSVFSAIEPIRKELKKMGYKKSNPFHRLIALTNSGIDVDTDIAKAFPELDWIIGSHSQSFTKFPVEEGQTKMVQVLSRNHYLGEIKISLKTDKSKDSFMIHEARDEKAKLLSPNPFVDFLSTHKQKLSKIQIEEQEAMTASFGDLPKYNTPTSCIECHQAQGEKWQKTAHSLAYLTLVKAQEENNLTCIKCHSLGLNSPHGFSKASELVTFEEEETKKLRKLKRDYIENLKNNYLDFSSIRKLPEKAVQKISTKWLKHDQSIGVTHNYANVQCLNCHDKHIEHPFSTSEVELSPAKKLTAMKNKCLKCHDPDQSPEWYKNNKPIESKILRHMKQVGCPKS
ncbi:hypothetical protein A9Q84_03430 [Halobacteriovorax marinus]|uniref:Cytochrome c-552/4 domain-containing protein n=1 Tax=Halobacteriovorax marinus TaxID=97084 RepID=A0A1Y5FGN7_9BACT|nr:hypothetical protein A9Q84_03430 [Halobacteriovorax marinus]